MNKSLLSLLAGALLTFAAPLVLAAPADAEVRSTDQQLNQLYSEGREAMARSDWRLALQRFSSLEQRMLQRGESNVDAAVFWQAYVQLQAKREADARRTIERLREKYPQSRWIAEAESLLRQSQPVDAAAAAGSGDAELAEIAVEGLMHAPPERALPLLRKVLRGQQPEKVKRRALFVLSQLDSAEALREVVEVARSGDAGLRGEAIRMLGVSGDDKALAELATLYKGAAPADRREVLQAWMIAERKDLVLAAARDETDAKLRQEAIQLLGAMEATAELKQLLPKIEDARLRREIVQALGVADDVDGLVQIAASDSDESVRLEAYRAIGVAGGQRASDALVALYPKATSAAQRDAILQGLLIADDAKAMTRLYKAAKTKEEKQQILRMLTVMDSEDALDLIEHELR